MKYAKSATAAVAEVKVFACATDRRATPVLLWLLRDVARESNQRTNMVKGIGEKRGVGEGGSTPSIE